MAEKQTIFSSPLWNKIFAILLVALGSYTGYDKYQESKSATETTVNVSVEGVDSAVHAHGEVLTRESVQALIAAAVAKQHKADLVIFKQKEPWE